MQLSELKLKNTDAAGVEVIQIYAINPPFYAVYRTSLRVMVHFADARADAEPQRNRLAALGALRGQINGLIDGWHSSNKPLMKSKADRLDRRVADALILALEGDMPNATALLTEIRDDVIADRTSRARFFYLVTALVTASVALGCVFIWPRATSVPCDGSDCWDMLHAIVGGIVGAFFSVALGLRGRTILTDFHWKDNSLDAALRIVVGTIAAAIVICLYKLKLLGGLQFSSEAEVSVHPWMLNFILGFLAGFSERMIPDLLAKANFAVPNPTAGRDAAVVAADSGSVVRPVAAATATATATTTVGEDHVEEAVDACLCDAPPVEGEEVTHDADLPQSTGGVSAEVVAPSTSRQAPPVDQTGEHVR